MFYSEEENKIVQTLYDIKIYRQRREQTERICKRNNRTPN